MGWGWVIFVRSALPETGRHYAAGLPVLFIDKGLEPVEVPCSGFIPVSGLILKSIDLLIC